MLEPAIMEQKAGGDLDEQARRAALETLRNANFRRVLDAIEAVKPSAEHSAPLQLLDVGCAHGWFLQLASARGFDVAGIEPDPNVKQLVSVPRSSIRHGFFPDVLDASERFDVISFNDVLEHIPDIAGAMDACSRHLAANGLLVVNAPDRTGALYRVSKVLGRLGMIGTFSRMWQEGFPSPHVHYLDGRWFEALARHRGFDLIRSIRLESVALDGLYDRIRIDPSTSRTKAALLTGAVAAALPVLKLAPPDIRVWLLKRMN